MDVHVWFWQHDAATWIAVARIQGAPECADFTKIGRDQRSVIAGAVGDAAATLAASVLMGATSMSVEFSGFAGQAPERRAAGQPVSSGAVEPPQCESIEPIVKTASWRCVKPVGHAGDHDDGRGCAWSDEFVTWIQSGKSAVDFQYRNRSVKYK